MAWCAYRFKIILFLLTITMVYSGCSNSRAVCPGAGQSKAADFNPFNEDGQPRSRKKKGNDNGLQSKKQPKKLNKH